MRKVHLDFETRSTVDIWERGAYVYATHPSTEVLCLSYAIDNGPVKKIRHLDLVMYPLIDPFEELRKLAQDEEYLFYAHNALFEQLIWAHKLIAKYGMLPLPISRWRCTAAKALAHGLPKALKDVALALGCTQQKDMGGKAIMLKMCKPKKDGSWNEDPADFVKLEDYCGQDVETERDVDHRLPELTPKEQEIWFEDQIINQRGVAVDREAITKSLAFIQEETERLKKEVYRLTDGVLDGVSRRNAVMAYFAKNGVNLPNFTKATVQKALDDGDIPDNLRDILRIRQQLGLTSTAKYITLTQTINDDNRLRDTLIYHSAGTGRWGGKLAQLQNLPIGTIKDTLTAINLIKQVSLDELRMMYDNVMGLFSSCIRGMFVAAPRHDLLVVDYSAIEARILAWFCGQADAVKRFREGKDSYVKMAQEVYSNPALTDEDKKERFLGKQIVLGCGYGMGPDRFMTECRKKGIKMDKTFAEASVGMYRKTYPKVAAMWYAQDWAVRTAITTKQEVKCGAVAWYIKGNFLYCKLPSGRSLAYHKPKIGTMPRKTLPDGTIIPARPNSILYMGTDSTTKKYVLKHTYGGKIIENIIQAIARDILAEAMLRSEHWGYPIVLTVHDELVAEIKETEKEIALEEFTELVTKVPDWAKGCPIAAKGWRGKRYKK